MILLSSLLFAPPPQDNAKSNFLHTCILIDEKVAFERQGPIPRVRPQGGATGAGHFVTGLRVAGGCDQDHRRCPFRYPDQVLTLCFLHAFSHFSPSSNLHTRQSFQSCHLFHFFLFISFSFNLTEIYPSCIILCYSFDHLISIGPI